MQVFPLPRKTQDGNGAKVKNVSRRQLLASIPAVAAMTPVVVENTSKSKSAARTGAALQSSGPGARACA
jgi:hypothetical protein